jgi:hypothetical protein
MDTIQTGLATLEQRLNHNSAMGKASTLDQETNSLMRLLRLPPAAEAQTLLDTLQIRAVRIARQTALPLSQ